MRIYCLQSEKFTPSVDVEAVRTITGAVVETVYPEETKRLVNFSAGDVLFLPAGSEGAACVELARDVQKRCPALNLIFVGDGELCAEAWELQASGYIRRPITADKLMRELNALRYREGETRQRVSVRCFGNFEAYVDGAPLRFLYERSKELLAYLVDRRGANCTTAELSAVLWDDDKNHSPYFQQLRKDLLSVLERAGCSGVVETSRGKMRVVPERINCDYYDYLNGRSRPGEEYRGEYMRQYSWAEYENAILQPKKK